MLTILVILVVVLTGVAALALLVAVNYEGGFFAWFATQGIINAAFEIVAALLKCLE